MTLIRRLLLLVGYQAFPPSARENERRASLQLYRTTGREVMGVPVKRPSRAAAPSAVTRKVELPDDRTE